MWARLGEPKTWEGITGVDQVFDEVFDNDGTLDGFKFYTSLGGRQYVGTASPGAREEGQSLSWNIATPEISGAVTVGLASAGDGTVVDVTMRVEAVSLMASMAFPFIATAIGNGFQATVDEFVAGFG